VISEDDFTEQEALQSQEAESEKPGRITAGRADLLAGHDLLAQALSR
jgi:hypothetical protein